MTVFTLWGQGLTGPLQSDTTSYTLGIQFSVSQAATLNAIWWYSASGANTLPDFIVLYAVSGQSLIVSQAPSWSGLVGSGWVRAPFNSPPSLSASTNYEACIGNDQGASGNWYGGIPNYWSTGAGSSGISNGPLSAPSNAASVNGQDCYNFTGAIPSYPSSTGGHNYLIDPEVNVVSNTEIVYYQMQTM